MTSDLVLDASCHPLARFVDTLEEQLTEIAETPTWSLEAGDLSDLLPRLDRVRRRLEAVSLTLLREADRHQVGDPVGAASTAGWWATMTRITRPEAHRAVALAERLDDTTHQPTAAGTAAGSVSLAQAAVILDAVEALPADTVSPDLRRDAERHLVALAEFHDPRELRVLGRKILDVVAPEVSEEHERRLLEAEEQHAAATASFTMRPDGHGSVVGRFKVPVLAGEILAKHLNAIAAPRHQAARGSTGAPDQAAVRPAKVSRPLRLGSAFVEYLETRDSHGLPKAGGIAATVVVTLTMTDLLGGTDQAATLDTGETISASAARRLACESGIIPAVLGTRSQVLDLGRKTRFHTEPQRIALMLRDRGCVAEGCDWPPGMCHAHHGKPWSQNGRTNVEDGMLFCPRHHTLAHDSRYQMQSGPNGKVIFNRRT